MTTWVESVFGNKKLGKLTSVRLVEEALVGRDNKWQCKCDCGETITVTQQIFLSEKGSCSKCKALEPKKRKVVTLWAYRKNSLRLYKINAAKRNLPWAITDAQALATMSHNCCYCGQIGGGIDRVDNTMGYSEENIAPCCSSCNYMKSDMTVLDFLSKVKLIQEFKKL